MSRIRSCLSSDSRDGGGRVEVGSEEEEGEREGELGWERAILLFVGRVRVWYRGKREREWQERRVRSELELKDERRSLRSCERARVPLDVCLPFLYCLVY